jgi:hypothetical protein
VTTTLWFAIVGVLGLLIVGLALSLYMQVNLVTKLKAEVRKLIGEKPKNWDSEVKNVWGLDDE